MQLSTRTFYFCCHCLSSAAGCPEYTASEPSLSAACLWDELLLFTLEALAGRLSPTSQQEVPSVLRPQHLEHMESSPRSWG